MVLFVLQGNPTTALDREVFQTRDACMQAIPGRLTKLKHAIEERGLPMPLIFAGCLEEVVPEDRSEPERKV
jgi:hypothetical protein